MEVLEKGAPLVRRENDNAYFGAFRAIRDKEGRIIGVQGILSHNHLVEATLGQIGDFTTIVVFLLVAVFTIIVWSYIRIQKVLINGKQF
ncbi:MAG: hypothetical protein GX301_08835 [Gracilibacteraceae bacterium]|nr:hypothetical protein [Gracilibacteraceae bacterium]